MTPRSTFAFGVFLLTGCFAAQSVSTEDTDEDMGGGSTSAAPTSMDSSNSTGQPTSSGTTATSSSSGSSSTDPTSTGTAADAETTTTGFESSSTSDTTGPSSSWTAGVEACVDGSDCVPAAPLGWTGPVIIAEASPDSLPDCPDAFPELQPSVFDSPLNDPAECGCACAVTEDAICSLELGIPTSAYGAAACVGGAGAPSVTSFCSGLFQVGGVASAEFHFGPSSPASGACSSTPSESLPEPEWQTAVRVCGARPTDGSCGPGESCVPALPDVFDRICIWAEGDVQCPDGEDHFVNRRTYYTDFDDGRSCEGSCGCSTGAECGSGQVDLFSDSDCSNIVQTVDIGSGCEDLNNQAFYTRAAFDGENASFCSVTTTPTPSGELLPDGPVTFCCS